MSEPFDQVKSAMGRVCDASTTNDGAAVARFFTDDGALLSPFGERADGTAVLVVRLAALLRRDNREWRLWTRGPMPTRHDELPAAGPLRVSIFYMS